jgi:hypothetical protein
MIEAFVSDPRIRSEQTFELPNRPMGLQYRIHMPRILTHLCEQFLVGELLPPDPRPSVVSFRIPGTDRPPSDIPFHKLVRVGIVSAVPEDLAVADLVFYLL